MCLIFNISRATIIQPCQGYLEGSVASNEGGELGQALLSTAPNTDLKMVMKIEKTRVCGTSIMFPPGFRMIRDILIRLIIASGKKTRSMLAPLRISLYWKDLSELIPLSDVLNIYVTIHYYTGMPIRQKQVHLF